MRQRQPVFHASSWSLLPGPRGERELSAPARAGATQDAWRATRQASSTSSSQSEPGRGGKRHPRSQGASSDAGDLDLRRHAGLDVVGWFVVAPRGASGVPVELVVERLLADPQRLRRARLVVLQTAQRRQDVFLLDLAERQSVGELEIGAFPSTRRQLAGKVL